MSVATPVDSYSSSVVYSGDSVVDHSGGMSSGVVVDASPVDETIVDSSYPTDSVIYDSAEQGVVIDTVQSPSMPSTSYPSTFDSSGEPSAPPAAIAPAAATAPATLAPSPSMVQQAGGQSTSSAVPLAEPSDLTDTNEPSPFDAPQDDDAQKDTQNDAGRDESTESDADVDDLFFGNEPSDEDQPMDAVADQDDANQDAAGDGGLDDLFSDPPATQPADPVAEDQPPIADDAPLDDLFGSPEPQQPADPPAADDAMDDLFGGGDADPMPADPMPADPEPADDAGALDDLFGGGDDVSDEPADGALDDLFGSEPAADAPSDDAASGAMDDLFGGDSGDTASDAAGDGALDDLFGEPAADPAADAEPAEESIDDTLDDLFNYHPATDAPREVIEMPTPAASNVASRLTATADPLAGEAIRTWTDNTGTFRTEGRLVELNADAIRIAKTNGRFCTVPMERLSEADARYVSDLAERVAVAKAKLLSAK